MNQEVIFQNLLYLVCEFLFFGTNPEKLKLSFLKIKKIKIDYFVIRFYGKENL
jgi:hypothetical protein